MIRKFLITLECLFTSILVYGYTPNSNRDYINNPHYAKSDAEWYANQGDIAKATSLYKVYSALTGIDISSDLEHLTLKSLPEWFDSKKMKAIPLSEGRVLIVYNQLMYLSPWAKDTEQNIIIPDLPNSGSWSRIMSRDMYVLMQTNGVEMPADGLFAGRAIKQREIGKTTITIPRGDNTLETIELPTERESVIVTIITQTGEKQIDGGCLIHESKLGNGLTPYIETKDYKKNFNVAYYPYKVLYMQNGIWLATDYSKDLKQVESKPTPTQEKLPKSYNYKTQGKHSTTVTIKRGAVR